MAEFSRTRCHGIILKWTGFSFPERFVPFGFPCPKESILFGGLDGHDPLGFTLLVKILFHSTRFTSRALIFCCALYAISDLPLPLYLPLAAPEFGLFQVVFHEKKCFSRIYCPMYWTTIFSVWGSLGIPLFVDSILNAERQQRLPPLKLTTRRMVPNLVVWLLLHHEHGFVPSRFERLHVVILSFDLQKFHLSPKESRLCP